MDLRKAGVREVRIQYGGEELVLKHRRMPLRLAILSAEAGDEATNKFLEWLGDNILEWNLTDGDEPVAPSREALEQLPMGLVLEIAKAVQTELAEEQVPLPTQGT